MNTPTPTNDTPAQATQTPAPIEPSFAEYVAARRSGKSIEAASVPSAPKADPSPEQKKSAPSDSVEDESEAKEIDESEVEASSSDDEASEDSDKDKPRKKGGFQRRIDKLNARAAAREQELEYWKSQAMKSGQAEPTKEKVEAKQTPTTGEPDPDQFDTHREYVKAVAKWELDQRESQREESAKQKAAIEERQKLFQSHAERVKAFAEKTEDFMESLDALDDVQVGPELTELIVSSEHGPALLYELAKNKSEAVRIAKLSPLAAARELGKIENRIAAKDSGTPAQEETKKLSTAPKPLEPVAGGASKVVKKSYTDPDISFSDYERLRREQTKRRR